MPCNTKIKINQGIKNYLLRIGKYLLLIFSLFAVERLVFLLTYHSHCPEMGLLDIFRTYYHALHLDISTAAYMFAIPFILFTLQLIIQPKWFDRILHIYTGILLFIIVFSAIGNLFLYDEWSTKINYKIWYYLSKPSEVIRTATWAQLIGGSLSGIALVAGLFWLYIKVLAKPTIEKINRFYWQTASILVAGAFLIFVGMRGKITGIPISQSSAYFSQHQLLNDAATNTQWHLMKTTIRFYKSNKYNLYACMDSQKAKKIVQQLYIPEKDTCIYVLKENRPNVVLIILESWSADMIESLGGKAGITPNFKKLEEEGLLFTQVYAAGRRSQEGISAIVSGFPPIPINSVTDNFEKYHSLPSVAKSLKREGYNTSFYFGGDLNYGNLRAYLMGMQFDHIIDEKDFPHSTPHGKLSIYDEHSLTRQLNELHNCHQPFFSALFTASSHSPYDVPTTAGTLDWDVAQLPFLNSVHYADWALGKYFEKAKKEGWYDNTLFILVADHSHETYKQWNCHDAGFQHIPMLWLGGALKEEFRGQHIDKLCSYIDLSFTLLHQLNISTDEYHWSNDILNPYTPQFSPFLNYCGIGWVTPQGSFSYDVERNAVYRRTIEDEDIYQREFQTAKAFLQELYQTYLDL